MTLLVAIATGLGDISRMTIAIVVLSSNRLV
jgi:hypothetical protein